MEKTDIKKRAAEAGGIFILIAAVFIAVNLLADGIGNTTVQIDGEYYSTSERELEITLMTEDGCENFTRLERLEYLKLIPYKAAVINSLNTDDPTAIAQVKKETDEVYYYCTDLAELSFLSEVTWLDRLDVSYCSVSDLSFLTQMENLTALNLSYTSVEDLGILADMDKIENLILSGINADFSPLLEMDGLTRVKLDKAAGDIADKLSQKGITVDFTDDTDEKAKEMKENLTQK